MASTILDESKVAPKKVVLRKNYEPIASGKIKNATGSYIAYIAHVVQ